MLKNNLTKLAVATAIASMYLGIRDITPVAAQAQVLPPGSTYEGKTLGEWTAEWWQAVSGVSNEQSPILNADPTGALTTAINNQSNPVFFLTGVVRPELVPVKRTVTISDRQALFFPLVNVVNVNVPDNPETVEQLRAGAAAFINSNSLKASIDGVNLEESQLFTQRELSPVFSVKLPEQNIFSLPSGVYEPAVSDGYWLLLTPLAPGEHTITFGGTTAGGFSQNNTYEIAVTSVPEPMSIIGFLAIATLGGGLTLRRKLEMTVLERYKG